jgi:hypothetical protein
MPSPFPGMNPYLEATDLSPGVHAALINEIRNRINGTAPPGYFADIEQRVYLLDTDELQKQLIVPDVAVRNTSAAPQDGREAGGTATLVAPVKAVISVPDQGIDVKERRIVIQTLDDHRIVTVIELLSPANKTGGSKGRENYLHKRHEVLDSDAHFVEIDLLRAGRGIQIFQDAPTYDYLICVSRQQERPEADWWPVLLEQPLPEIPIPLRRGNPDLKLDLQAIMHDVYDRSGYSRRLDYSQPAPPPDLSDSRRKWVSETIGVGA